MTGTITHHNGMDVGELYINGEAVVIAYLLARENHTGVLVLPAGSTDPGEAPLKFTAGDLRTSPEAGTMEYDGSRFYLTEQTVRRIISVASDPKLSDTVVANTTDVTSIYSADVAADGALAGKVYKVSLFGRFSAANAADTLTFSFKMDGTTVPISLTPKVVSDQQWQSVFTLIIRTVGVTGTFAAYTELVADNTLYHSTPVTGTIDTTMVSALETTVQWDNALAGNTVTCMGGYLEDIN